MLNDPTRTPRMEPLTIFGAVFGSLLSKNRGEEAVAFHLQIFPTKNRGPSSSFISILGSSWYLYWTGWSPVDVFWKRSKHLEDFVRILPNFVLTSLLVVILALIGAVAEERFGVAMWWWIFDSMCLRFYILRYRTVYRKNMKTCKITWVFWNVYELMLSIFLSLNWFVEFVKSVFCWKLGLWSKPHPLCQNGHVQLEVNELLRRAGVPWPDLVAPSMVLLKGGYIPWHCLKIVSYSLLKYLVFFLMVQSTSNKKHKFERIWNAPCFFLHLSAKAYVP